MEKFHPVDTGALRPGTEVGSWRLESMHRKGSYGVIYRARKRGWPGSRPCALKLALHSMNERFEREVELLSRIAHPHVPRFLDKGEWTAPDGARFPFLVMEWVEGEPLYEWASKHRPTSRATLKLLSQVAGALAATHAEEAVHRDVKGDNVLVTKGGRAVLVDYGSGCYQGARVLTRELMPPGTSRYWSPEAQLFQWRFGRRATARYEAGQADDVYALGVMAYRLVTGSYPPPALEWEEALDTFRLASPERVAPEAQVTMSPELATLIRQMLANEAAARGTAIQVAQALELAAKTAGGQANQPITLRQGGESLARTPRLLRWLPAMAGAGWLSATTLAVLLAARQWRAESEKPELLPIEAARGTQDSGGEDGGTSALGDEVLTAPAHARMPDQGRRGVGLDMPKNPFPGQRTPPCEKPEIEVNGGCWVRLADATPPCGPRSYEWQKGCYWPSFENPRPPTSEQP